MLVELNYPTPIPVELDPAQTLLLIVDMENESAHPKAPLYMGEPVERIIPRIAALRKYVRESGGKVVHTQSVRKPEALEFTLFKNVIRKIEGTHDCFYQTNLEALLKQLGMKPGEARIIVTGVATRGCVQCAVTGFSIRDYYVYVPIDCTAQRDEKEMLQAFSLFAGFAYRYNVTMTESKLIQLGKSGALREAS
jgi:nicotinamidase-related amidase